MDINSTVIGLTVISAVFCLYGLSTLIRKLLFNRKLSRFGDPRQVEEDWKEVTLSDLIFVIIPLVTWLFLVVAKFEPKYIRTIFQVTWIGILLFEAVLFIMDIVRCEPTEEY